MGYYLHIISRFMFITLWNRSLALFFFSFVSQF
jgi:hypothetical protein